jgi:hypothetical protein
MLYIGEKLKKHEILRWLQNDSFAFFVIQQRSEGYHVFMFFLKRKKNKRFFARLQNYNMIIIPLMPINQSLTAILRL